MDCDPDYREDRKQAGCFNGSTDPYVGPAALREHYDQDYTYQKHKRPDHVAGYVGKHLSHHADEPDGGDYRKEYELEGKF